MLVLDEYGEMKVDFAMLAIIRSESLRIEAGDHLSMCRQMQFVAQGYASCSDGEMLTCRIDS